MPLSMFVSWLLLAAVYAFCTLLLSFHLAFLNILTHFCTQEKAFDPNLLKETNTFSHLPLSMFVSRLLIPQVLCFGTHSRLLDAIYVFCTLPSSFHLAFLNIRTRFCTREKASDPNLLKETNTLLRGFQEKLLSISSHTVLVSCMHFLNQRAHTLKTGLGFYLLCKHMQVPMVIVICLCSMSHPPGCLYANVFLSGRIGMMSAGRPGAWMFAPGTRMYAQTALCSPYSLFSYFTFSSSPSHPLATPSDRAIVDLIIRW